MTMIHLAPGTTLRGGTYHITRFISSGGFGCTYEGKHTMLGVRVAIKEFFVKDFCNRNRQNSCVEVGTESKVDLVDKLRKKFIEEARVLYRFSHPNIVHVSDIFEENGTAYYVMDYIDGESLHEKVQRHGHLDEKQALDYILQVADALEYVHNHNRLHLDVKPGNIMVAPGNRAVLIDFGISKHYDDASGENTSTMLGVNTPGYAPHEQITQSLKTFSPATDIYALGATFYKLLTGVTPPNSVALMGKDMVLAPLPLTISVQVRNAIYKAMQSLRAERPQTIAEFRRLLEDKHGEKQENVMDETVLDGGICSGQVSTTSGMKYVVDGNSGTYSGDLLNGVPHGSGTFVYDDGRKYVGEFKNGKRHGQGTLVWKGGDKYVGEFKGGNKSGQGTYYYSNGNKYVGEWKDGKRIGQGTYYNADGSIAYQGEWNKMKKIKRKSFDNEPINYDGGKNKNILNFVAVAVVLLLVGGLVGYRVTSDSDSEGYPIAEDGYFEPAEIVSDSIVVSEDSLVVYEESENVYKEPEKVVSEVDNKSTTSGMSCVVDGSSGTYSGDLLNGVPHGSGTFVYDEGQKYVGEFKNGKYHGNGTYYYSNGNKYVGGWKDGLKHGQGTYIWGDGSIWAGDKYVGEWKYDYKNGQGTEYNDDGKILYKGEFKDGRYNGQGILYDDGKILYKGEFKDGEMCGKGVLITTTDMICDTAGNSVSYLWTRGDKYIGEFKGHLFHGQGTYYNANGSIRYKGEFKDGKMHGLGFYTWKDGRKYVGEFKDGKRSGQGSYTWPNGDKYVGGWKDGLKHGQGIYYNADGTIKYKGLWENGEFVE